jgi:hypothetical protein
MTTPTSEDIYLAQPEVELGVARRACPKCTEPLVIRMPPPVPQPVAPADGAAIRLGFNDLTALERQVFDRLYAHFPLAVTRKALEHESDLVSSSAALDRMTRRLRRKLVARGWQLIATYGLLRLVEPPEC